MRRALGRLARRAGIVAQYTDQTGRVRRTAPETEAALLAAMGFDCSSAAALEAEAAALARPRALPEWRVLTAGRRARLPGLGDATAWEIETEAGGALAGRGPALPALPAGIHRLRAGRDEGREAACWLIAAPRSLALPPRGWGVTLPLYGLRTPDEGGLGDYADLAAAAAGLAAAGADFLGINPVHAGFPAVPGAASPYQPSDRRRLATGHIHVPGAAPAARGALIDYRAEMPARMAALERAWAGFAGSEAFEAFRAREGAALRRFALHAAIAEREGPFWPDWPEPLRRPDSPEVAALARALAPRVRFHEWLQFEADRQLGAAAAAGAGMRHGLYLDLAVGVHPAGAETWAEPGLFARGVSLGAPPDAFSEAGQRWELAPYDPRALAAAGFRPLAETLRALFRHAGLVRIDHILGFDRAFWVPDGGAPGAYVRMPKAALLAVVRLEAARAGACVVGEDLGNIPRGLQEDLARSGILGCRLAMFEEGRAAAAYAERALASFGTHDLPTWKGWRAGRDIALRAEIAGLAPEAAAVARARRAAEVAALEGAIAAEAGGTDAGDVAALHRFLAATPARLVALQIEDILGLAEQANLPGTVAEHPNWRRRLPVPAAALGADPRLRTAAEAMRAAGR